VVVVLETVHRDFQANSHLLSKHYIVHVYKYHTNLKY